MTRKLYSCRLEMIMRSYLRSLKWPGNQNFVIACLAPAATDMNDNFHMMLFLSAF